METRPLAVDTSLLFPMIRSAVRTAEMKFIDHKRCFVVSEAVFLNIMSYVFVSGKEFRFDSRIAADGYENFQFSFGARDTHDYYLCAKIPPLLDELWQDKGPKEVP